MKTLIATVSLFAALLGSIAQAQIITNYGQNTYGPLAPGGPYAWNGAWDGSEGLTASGVRTFMAQTFVVPAGSGTLYAYNIQVQRNNTVTVPTFTTAIYEWNTGTNNTVALISGTSASFSVTQNDFDIYGVNYAIPSGITLDPFKTYAIVVQRTNTSVGNQPVIGTDSQDVSNSYQLGQAFRSSTGTSWNTTALSGTDLAFWVSFASNSLSPVPEPAVNGAVIGVGLVVMLAFQRRRKAAKASEMAA
jgi:hypothetical protein